MFGIGDGSIEIKVDKTSFKKGDIIKGKVMLDLKKPVKAMWLRIDVVGESKLYSKEGSGIERRTVSQTTRQFWSRNKLGEQKEYPAGKSEYDFSVKIPKDLTEWKTNAYGALQGMVDKATEGVTIPLSWYLQARLDKAWQFSTVATLPIELK